MRFRLASLALLLLAAPTAAQSFPTDDPVIKRIWDEGMTDRSQAANLAQALMDSIGPRLAGSPGYGAAVKWLQQRYTEWGIPVRTEQYGTWRGWQRYQTHMDLVAPRFRTLEATMLAWSPSTNGRWVEAGELTANDDSVDARHDHESGRPQPPRVVNSDQGRKFGAEGRLSRRGVRPAP